MAAVAEMAVSARVAVAVVMLAAREAGVTAVTTAAKVEVEERRRRRRQQSVWVVVRPYPLLPPIPIVVLRGGMQRTTSAHAMAFEGSRVRGFGGSGVWGSIPGPHPEGGIIGPQGLATSKCSSPGAYM